MTTYGPEVARRHARKVAERSRKDPAFAGWVLRCELQAALRAAALERFKAMPVPTRRSELH